MPDSNELAPPCTLVIFGASGDLTARKLVPAIERLATFDRLPDSFALVGVARSPMTDEEFRSRCRDAAKRPEGPSAQWERLVSTRALRERWLRRPADLRDASPACSTSWTAARARRATARSTSPLPRTCSPRSR